MKKKYPLSVSEKLALFNFKSEYLTYSENYEEIGLDSFIEKLFIPDILSDYPFEDVNCEEYARWRDNDTKEAQYKEGQPYAYNALILLFKNMLKDDGDTYLAKRNVLLLRDDTKVLDDARQAVSAYMSPITYVGHRASYQNSRFIYALVFDLDGVGEWQIKDLFHQIDHERWEVRLPRPNIVVNSGNGLHLYYLLEKPIALFDQQIKLLNRLKRALTTKIWNTYTSTYDERQYQGIVQSFRLPESKTKLGGVVKAFYDENVPRYTIDKLNSYAQILRLSDEEIELLDKGKRLPNRLTLEGAKEQYPEWYQERIIEGKPKPKPKKWKVKRALYDWWLNLLWADDGRKIIEGHRYFCLYTLVSYAVKCGISYDEVKEDVIKLVPVMDTYTKNQDNHFTIADAMAALKAYDDDSAHRITREWIERHTFIRVDKTKRNGRKQSEHLRVMNVMRDNITHPNGEWRNTEGRPIGSGTKKEVIRQWRTQYPNGSKSQCAKDTGLSRTTVIKWWE